jgi:hypothetical protein
MISVNEARQILGKKSEGMSDEEIKFVVETLDLMAKDALKISKEQVHRKRDAYRLAQLTYDIYQNKKD